MLAPAQVFMPVQDESPQARLSPLCTLPSLLLDSTFLFIFWGPNWGGDSGSLLECGPLVSYHLLPQAQVLEPRAWTGRPRARGHWHSLYGDSLHEPGRVASLLWSPHLCDMPAAGPRRPARFAILALPYGGRRRGAGWVTRALPGLGRALLARPPFHSQDGTLDIAPGEGKGVPK